MSDKFSVRYIYAISILYILVVACSSIFPAWYNWGASTLRVFNEIGVLIAILSMAVILIPSVQQRLLQFYALTIKKYQLQSSLKRRSAIISIIIFLVFSFWHFNQKLFFLGDGYLLQRNLPLINAPIEVFGFYKNSPLSGLIFYAASLLLKVGGVNNYALAAYQWVSIMSGVMTIFFLNKIGKYLFPDLAIRFIFIIGVLSAASSQMFFSYVENYSVGILILTLYTYCSLRYLAERQCFIIVTLSFIILIFSHYGMALAGPSYLFLVYKEFRQKRYRSIIANLLLLCATFVSFYLAVYNRYPLLYDSLFNENSHLLIRSMPGTLEFSYSFLSSYHIIDVINLLLFVFPLTILLIPYIVWTIRFRTILLNDRYLYMSLCAVGTLLFLFSMKSDLGLSRDWDLYTLYLFPTIVVSVLIVIKSLSDLSSKNAFIIIFIMLIHSIAWIAINASSDLSMKYITTLPNDKLWSKKAIAHTIDEFSSFYVNKGDYKQALRYDLKYLEYDPANLRMIENVASIYFYIFHDDQKAQSWHEKAVKAESNDWQIYNNLAEIRMRQQDYQSAMKLLEKSISINPPSSQPKLNLAWILSEAQNQKKDALALYEEVLLTEPENTNALLNAGYLSYQLKKYERTKNYLRHFLNLLPNNPESKNIQNLLNSLQ